MPKPPSGLLLWGATHRLWLLCFALLIGFWARAAAPSSSSLQSPPAFAANATPPHDLVGVWARASVRGHAAAAAVWPGPRQGHTATAVGKRVFVYGGVRGLHGAVLNELWVLDVLNSTTTRWTAVRPGDTPATVTTGAASSVAAQAKRTQPPPLVGHTATAFAPKQAADNTTIFVIGGRSANRWHDDVWALDTRSLQWRRVRVETPGGANGAVAFSSREGHTATLVGSRILVFGGFADPDSDVGADRRVLALDLTSWRSDGSRKLRWVALNATAGGPRRTTSNVALLLDQHFLTLFHARATAEAGITNAEVSSILVSGSGADSSAGRPWHVQPLASTTWIATEGVAASPLDAAKVLAYGGCGAAGGGSTGSGRKCHTRMQVLRQDHHGHWGFASVHTMRQSSSMRDPFARAGHTLTLVPTDHGDRIGAATTDSSSSRQDFRLLMLGGCGVSGECAGGDAAYFLHVSTHPQDYLDKCDASACQARAGKCDGGTCVIAPVKSGQHHGKDNLPAVPKKPKEVQIVFVVDVDCPHNCSAHGVCNRTTGRCMCDGLTGRGEATADDVEPDDVPLIPTQRISIAGGSANATAGGRRDSNATGDAVNATGNSARSAVGDRVSNATSGFPTKNTNNSQLSSSSSSSFLSMATAEFPSTPKRQQRPSFFGPSCASGVPFTKKVTVSGSGSQLVVPVHDPRVERVSAVDYHNKRVEIDVPRAGPLLVFIPVLQSVLEAETATAAAAAAAIAIAAHPQKASFGNTSDVAAAASDAIRTSAAASAEEVAASSFIQTKTELTPSLPRPGLLAAAGVSSFPPPPPSSFLQVTRALAPPHTDTDTDAIKVSKKEVHLRLKAYEGQGVIVDCPRTPPSTSSSSGDDDCPVRRLMMHSDLSSRGRFLQAAGPAPGVRTLRVKFTHVSERLQAQARAAIATAGQRLHDGAIPSRITARTPPASDGTAGGGNIVVYVPSTGEVLQGLALEWYFVPPKSRIAADIEEGFAKVGDWFAALGKNTTEAQKHIQLAAMRRAAAQQRDVEMRTALLAGHADIVLAASGPRGTDAMPDLFGGPPAALKAMAVSTGLPLSKRYRNGTEFVILQDSFPPVQLPLNRAPCKCGSNGMCSSEGTCICYRGWSGASCQVASCPNNCTDAAHGECTKAAEGATTETCRCNYGYSGPACSVSTGCGNLGRTCGPHADCVPHRALLQSQPSPVVGELHRHALQADLLAPPPPHATQAAAALAAGAHPNLPLAVPPGRAAAIQQRAKTALHGAARDVKFFQDTLYSCDCHAGWAGPYCRVEACPNNCTSAEHGSCAVVDRQLQCVCRPGFSGRDCSRYLACEGDGRCSKHGVCERGNCRCDAGWAGKTCAERATCAADRHCSGHGSCLRGLCACDPDFTGTACDIRKPCLHDCSGHGVCRQGICTCLPGFMGLDCSVVNTAFCPGACSGKGRCFNGQCFCDPGFTGGACETELACPTGPVSVSTGSGSGSGSTTGAGLLTTTTTVSVTFDSDQTPPADKSPPSKQLVSETPCSGHGICQYGKCFCDPAYSGTACAKRRAPVAVADGAAAAVCTPKTELGAPCSAHGVCVDAQCRCVDGFVGAGCEMAHKCNPSCGSHGVCLFGTCQCQPGWAGASCREQAHTDCMLQKPLVVDGLPQRCSGHGMCDAANGQCTCQSGWFGDSCEHGETALLSRRPTDSGVVTVAATPASFTARADCAMRCVHGECLATGVPRLDAGGVVGAGTFAEVYCSCEPGWRGAECNQRAVCHANCSGHGFCHLGSCFCDPGFEGGSCHVQRECPSRCKFGICIYGRCACIEGFTGKSCSEPTSGAAVGSNVPQLPSPRGQSVMGGGDGSPAALLRVNGLVPTRRLKADVSFCPTGRRANATVRLPCSGNGNCSMGECSCHAGWYGRACDRATAAGPCPNRCSGRGLCDEGSGHCLCEPGWYAADCSTMSRQRIAADAAACSAICGSAATGSHGTCVNGSCVCELGYSGLGCTVRTCPNGCSNVDFERRGDCISGKCICRAGYGGVDCSVTCPNACSGHGACHSEDRMSNGLWQCYCEPGWYGDACDASGAWYATWPYMPVGGLVAAVVLAVLFVVCIVLLGVYLYNSYRNRKDSFDRVKAIYETEKNNSVADLMNDGIEA